MEPCADDALPLPPATGRSDDEADDSNVYSEDSLSELTSGDVESDATTGDAASLASDDDDSEDDMTDVSPLSSASASPVPPLPCLTAAKPPSTRVRIRSPECETFGSAAAESDERGATEKCDPVDDDDASVDFRLLSQVVSEMESEAAYGGAPMALVSRPISQASSARSGGGTTRRNMSFSNEKVRQIDRENQRLLSALMRAGQSRTKRERRLTPPPKLSSSAVNRMREQRRIDMDNQALLKRIQTTKASKEVGCASLDDFSAKPPACASSRLSPSCSKWKPAVAAHAGACGRSQSSATSLHHYPGVASAGPSTSGGPSAAQPDWH
ncbi:PREDICTED: cilia- and flagella-associated protein 97-like [Priapulus caudatus]|uniref:Cilia- and flagella-associated protein 97-like n=1 Tax=Priapulus caudatus TaxID=37621 RepID=A0ABM1ES91_PRICU|nr:PREDICTED: cilia- and flagella-associated protein 97-like [Priapulus caudatus]